MGLLLVSEDLCSSLVPSKVCDLSVRFLWKLEVWAERKEAWLRGRWDTDSLHEEQLDLEHYVNQLKSSRLVV